MKDYNKTPSFYNNEEVFKKYLGQTSYYLSLQNAVSKIVFLIKPKSILELGSGTGTTVNKIASENKTIEIIAVDIREEMVTIGQKMAIEMNNDNLKFKVDDMIKYIKECDIMPEFTYMLYSFHHINDPLCEKYTFLENCYNKMNVGSRICIAETFLPEYVSEIELQSSLKKLWSSRSIEGYASTFWESLERFDEQGIADARAIGVYSYDYEWLAGELVAKRNNEYLITLKWLCETAKDIGFDIEIAEPSNNNNDYVVVLKKI